MTPQSKSIVSFYDFRRGGVTQVPRDTEPKLQDALKAVLQTSYQQRALVPLEGTPFRLFADHSTLGDGNAFFIIDTSERLGKGYVAPDTTLCSVGVACQLATAPLAWRGVIGRYISYVAKAPFGASLNALGCMPQSLPWLCGYSPQERDRLTPAESESLNRVIHAAGLVLLEQCEAGARKTARTNGPIPVDPECFPELGDWAN